MNKEIIEYTITHNDYCLKVLNIGATITEYSLGGHNVCLSYDTIDGYRTNELYAGAIVGRSAGRIQNAKFGNWDLPHNYLEKHNHHGNDLHLAFYQVEVMGNKIELTVDDPEGDYPGDAKIKVVYTLDDDGLTQEIYASSDKPTLFNFTNHTYFKLSNDLVLDDYLQIDCTKYTHLNDEMFSLEDKDVANTAFDFRESKQIKAALNQDDNGQFAITKFIDHPFKLDGKLVYENANYQLTIATTSSYVVIYAGNYIGDCKTKLKGMQPRDYSAICFETQERPGYTQPSDNYYSKTTFTLERK